MINAGHPIELYNTVVQYRHDRITNIQICICSGTTLW